MGYLSAVLKMIYFILSNPFCRQICIVLNYVPANFSERNSALIYKIIVVCSIITDRACEVQILIHLSSAFLCTTLQTVCSRVSLLNSVAMVMLLPNHGHHKIKVKNGHIRKVVTMLKFFHYSSYS